MKVNMVATIDEGGISTYSGYLSDKLEEEGLLVEKVENKLLEQNPFFYFDLVSESCFNCDVVHIQHEFGLFGRMGVSGIYAYIYYPLLDSDVPVVTTFHEVESLQTFREAGKLLETFITNGRCFLSFPIFAYSDIIIVHNERAKNILKGMSVENVEVIPHGVVQKEPTGKRESKKYLGIDENKKVVTLFGFINKFKGHDRVVKRIDKLDEDVILYIAGKPSPMKGAKEYRLKLEETASEKGCGNKIEFHGFVDEDEFKYVFGASDLMVFPYRHITESGAMSLAFGYGKPILASDLPVFQGKPIEVCKEDDWAGKINDIVHDESKLVTMEEKSKKYAEENSWGNVAKDTVEVYEKARYADGRDYHSSPTRVLGL